MSELQRPGEAATAITIQRRWPLVSGCSALGLVAVAGTLIALRAYDVVPYPVDDGWMNYLTSRRTPTFDGVARVFDLLGGGLLAILVVPILGAALAWWRRGRWTALYLLLALSVSAGLVQLIKNLVGRPRPESILVTADFGSFPSGHAANAATLATAAAVIMWRVWVWAVGTLYVVAMMISRNYLGAHWFTDTVGGLFLGVAVAVICWAPLAYRVFAERRHGTAQRAVTAE